MDPKDPQFPRLDKNNQRFVNAVFNRNEDGVPRGNNRPVDPDLISEARAMRDNNHEHDYSDSKHNDTCSTCGSKNPNDSYDKGKD